jgi:hypothetical protein
VGGVVAHALARRPALRPYACPTPCKQKRAPHPSASLGGLDCVADRATVTVLPPLRPLACSGRRLQLPGREVKRGCFGPPHQGHLWAPQPASQELPNARSCRPPFRARVSHAPYSVPLRRLAQPLERAPQCALRTRQPSDTRFRGLAAATSVHPAHACAR